MEKLKKLLTTGICKHGTIIASLAFIVTMITANSQCTIPFYEPEEPIGLSKFKKFNAAEPSDT